ncbi:MAG: TonB-dependent receptor [Kangiellaceae bacterium]|nr:TonB-dependent receptor [Kangiellaceae bacterium]MCW9001050.1 TonB-dependent receptor [Kangiellaceae bacterium]
MKTNELRKSAVYLAIASVLCSPVYAEEQEEKKDDEYTKIIVTSTRRANDIQDIPINVFAFNDEQMESMQVKNAIDIAKWVPGLTVTDQGGRAANQVIVRGLNTDSSGPAGGTGGTVGNYIGEIPVYIDLKLTDIDRVEVLIGPQGTLYGAGTLGGAIRYIPRKPDLSGFDSSVFFGLSQTKESDSTGYETGFVLNTPVNRNFGFRTSVVKEDRPGFIDYNYVVREGGVSNPQPDFNNPQDVAANLRQVEDANYVEILAGKVAARYMPTEYIDATLTYYYQEQRAGGRNLVHYYPELASSENFMSGAYESGYRYQEPNNRTDELISLEVTFEFDFADLVSATGLSKYKDHGQRDQTDLLLGFEYGYEGFPSFSAYTREDTEQEILTEEIRLVSKGDGPLTWIVGYYYNNNEIIRGDSKEFTPGIADFWGVNRPDGLEYYSASNGELTEQAFFGEIGYQFTDEWQVTIGARSYQYENEQASGFDLPLLNTAQGNYGPDETNLKLTTNSVDDDGSLFKFNTSYDFSDDLKLYYTLSEGYRIGGINSVTPCPDPLPPGVQNLCAQPDEILILPDRTTNNEIGIRSNVFDGQFAFNAAFYHVAWEDVQVGDVTQNGSLPITSNGGEAESRGVELSLRGRLSDNWKINTTYAYTDAKLTQDAPGLVGGTDALAGDRLPGAPQQSSSLGLTYDTEVFGGFPLEVNYSLNYTGDIFTKVGNRNNGERLPSYTLHGVSATIRGDNWDGTFYVKNLTDEYVVTAVRNDYSFLRDVGGFDLRRYGRYINTPRTLGVMMTYYFD